jgi:hypothetical protein
LRIRPAQQDRVGREMNCPPKYKGNWPATKTSRRRLAGPRRGARLANDTPVNFGPSDMREGSISAPFRQVFVMKL